jgi:hypothetical protein
MRKVNDQGRFVKTDPIVRFWSYVEKTDNCWFWKGFKYQDGYGGFKYEGKHIKAHRYSYLLHFGNLPSNLLVRHSCDNKLCVNPNHLSLGSHIDNMKDMTDRNRQSKGSEQHLSKLTEEQVLEIKNYLKNFYRGIYTHLGKKYNVTPNTIFYIAKGKTWKHV